VSDAQNDIAVGAIGLSGSHRSGRLRPCWGADLQNMKTSSDNNVYGSGLNLQDWIILSGILLPFLHAKNLDQIEIPQVPEHLIHHPFMEAIRIFKDTGNDEFLDKAGQCLVPTDKPFGWYVAVTK
jgi:hypothetical protein